MDEKLASMSKAGMDHWLTSESHFSAIAKPVHLSDINASMLSRFQKCLRDRGIKESTIGSYLKDIRRALNWAVKLGLLAKRPYIEMPKRAGGASKLMRSRPILLEDLEKLIATTPKVREHDHDRWVRFLKGLWHSGLRIGELLTLSWDADADLSIDKINKIPMIRILADGQKRREDEFQPITPEFWELICKDDPLPKGPVFRMGNGRNGKQMAVSSVGKVIGKIGKRAGVVTEHKIGKCATSHDIGRRAFATRMSQRLTQSQLAEWMRHASTQTTADYYVRIEAQDLAKQVWDQIPSQMITSREA